MYYDKLGEVWLGRERERDVRVQYYIVLHVRDKKIVGCVDPSKTYYVFLRMKNNKKLNYDSALETTRI